MDSITNNPRSIKRSMFKLLIDCVTDQKFDEYFIRYIYIFFYFLKTLNLDLILFNIFQRYNF